MKPEFLTESYETESLKTLSLWAQFRSHDLRFRPEARARSPHEHFVHQCQSEWAWMTKMLGIETGHTPLPEMETLDNFIEHYATTTSARLQTLRDKSGAWYDEETSFFGETRSKSWILLRRMTHNAHHRGQLTIYLRVLSSDLYSTYGPTADTGGLAPDGAQVIYPWPNLESLLDAITKGEGPKVSLPGRGPKSPSERPA